jgi:DegV family protein with EDD domain
MGKIAIVTDTSVTIPEDLIRKHDIHLMPLVFHLDNKTYRDTIDVKTTDELFRMVSKSSNFPTTAAPPPGEYAELYRRLGKKADAIFNATISANLSMTFKSATQAREEVKSELPNLPIEVFDSKTTVGAMGFIVLAAARAAASGQGIKAVVKAAEDTRTRINYLFMMDTLSYLARSGRISKAAALAGNMLSMKPLTEISTVTGRPSVLARPRTKKKALQSLMEIVRQRVTSPKPIHVMIDHTGLVEEAESLKETFLSEFNCAEVLVCRYNPISSLIVGPGGVGFGFYQE